MTRKWSLDWKYRQERNKKEVIGECELTAQSNNGWLEFGGGNQDSRSKIQDEVIKIQLSHQNNHFLPYPNSNPYFSFNIPSYLLNLRLKFVENDFGFWLIVKSKSYFMQKVIVYPTLEIRGCVNLGKQLASYDIALRSCRFCFQDSRFLHNTTICILSYKKSLFLHAIGNDLVYKL